MPNSQKITMRGVLIQREEGGKKSIATTKNDGPKL